MSTYKEAYLREFLDDFKFLDPECHDVRTREINMRTKRCNRCPGFNECKMHPHFWLEGISVRMASNEKMEEIPDLPPYQDLEAEIPEAEAPV